MKRSPPAESPDAYLEALDGWRREIVTQLRVAVLDASDDLDEVIRWGHLVYLYKGPVLLIRAEAHRVLFGFWRGKRLTDIEPRLRPSGKYEMATLELREGMDIAAATIQKLTVRAVALNDELGDPRKAAD